MKKYNPELKKYMKKHRFYNTDPLVYVDDLEDIETGYDIFMATRNFPDDEVWHPFIQNHLEKFTPMPFPFEEQLPFILFVSSEQMQISIVKHLKRINGFNPSIDPIPFDKLPTNIVSYITKKQEELKIIKKQIHDNTFFEKNIIGIYCDLDYNNELDRIFRHLKIDIVIFANGSNLKIKFHNFKRKFYEIQGKTVDLDSFMNILIDYTGKPKEENGFLIMQNTISQGDLVEILKSNII